MPYKNKEDQKKAARRYYEQNKDLMKCRAKDNNRLALKRNKQFVRQYLEQHPCVDCGENDPIVLEFDHLRDKLHNLADMVRKCHSLESIKEEIEKCEVRCANCHRRITHKRRTALTGAG